MFRSLPYEARRRAQGDAPVRCINVVVYIFYLFLRETIIDGVLNQQ